MLPALCQAGPLLPRGGAPGGPGLVQAFIQRLGDAPSPTPDRMLIQRLEGAHGPGPVQTLIQRLADAPSPASAWIFSGSRRVISVLCQPRLLPRGWGMPHHGAEHTKRVFFSYFFSDLDDSKGQREAVRWSRHQAQPHMPSPPSLSLSSLAVIRKQPPGELLEGLY